MVIGAGVIGTALAAQLGDGETGGGRPAQVWLLDGGEPGAGTTASSMAWINAHSKSPRHYHELAVSGMRAHAALARRTGPAAYGRGEGAGPGWYRPGGALRWASGGEGLDQLRRTVARLKDWGYAAEWIPVTRARELEPALRIEDAARVAYFPDEAAVDPQPLVAHLLATARARGVHVRTGEDARVVAVDTAGGRVRGVRCAGGETVPADVAVCCAGWRTPAVAALAGAYVPLVPGDAPGSEAPTLLAHLRPGADAGPPLTRMVLSPRLHARPLAGGRVYLEALDLNDEVDRHTPADRVTALARELHARARDMLPAVARTAGLVAARVCTRPLPPDDNSIVGPHAEAEGLYTVVTHSGMTLSLRLGELVARELLTGREAPELAPYRPARFVRR
ncbi:FAD-binding oxidoreductase [Streptomyces sp. WMMC500]|uniref:NAD(P)/FAD-dependent oxidoreductase n=1 Tax=Streptomyces sp. WMMC500 TaxID=3015154 RepID=UPI00248C51EB|nr:FAD-binding oxidoreductase [Streptomyces sp. WMMC500]WBB57756.1 FAD-binding oxidoreductase [Streptomyces sp. WMMC500]